MGVSSRRQLRAAVSFLSRPLLLALSLTVTVRTLFSAPDSAGPRYSKALVVASTAADDVSWLSSVPSDWSVHRYVVDAPPASPDLSVPANKGNEAMVYLSYIITHYDALPDVVFFHHAHNQAWHQELDSAEEVARLRPSYIAQQGYASARCLPGCENVVPLADHRVELREFRAVARNVHLTTLLDEFLSPEEKGSSVPEKLAAPCCAQFAASREAIRRRGREWWVRLREWLLETPLDSRTSGRLMEHTWHVWFGQPFEHCPDYNACRCHLFGIGDCERYFEEEKLDST